MLFPFSLTISYAPKWRDVLMQGVHCLDVLAPITGHKHRDYKNNQRLRKVSSCDVCKQLPLQDSVYMIVVGIRLTLFKNTRQIYHDEVYFLSQLLNLFGQDYVFNTPSFHYFIHGV